MIVQREKSAKTGVQQSNISALSPALLGQFLLFSKRMRDDPTFQSRNKAKYGFGQWRWLGKNRLEKKRYN